MRLIDADKMAMDESEAYLSAKSKILPENMLLHNINAVVHKKIQMMISDTPTVDAVEVVRCKDCKHYKEFRTKRNKQIMRLCCRMGKNDMEYSVKPDDFCSYGERSDDNAAD